MCAIKIIVLARPHLEYANVVWGTPSKGDSDLIVSVQRRDTGMVPELKHLPYVDRLHHLKLPSMTFRRWRYDPNLHDSKRHT